MSNPHARVPFDNAGTGIELPRRMSVGEGRASTRRPGAISSYHNEEPVGTGNVTNGIGSRVLGRGTGKQEKLGGMQEVCGEKGAKTLPQSKIHSQVHFNRHGVAWFGTHCYDWNTLEQFQKSPTDYSGGHLISYDLRTRQAKD